MGSIESARLRDVADPFHQPHFTSVGVLTIKLVVVILAEGVCLIPGTFLARLVGRETILKQTTLGCDGLSLIAEVHVDEARLRREGHIAPEHPWLDQFDGHARTIESTREFLLLDRIG